MDKQDINPGDVVLLYVGAFPQAFLHVKQKVLDPACVSGIGYHITFRRLEIPMMEFVWHLNEDHINLGWTMNGQPHRIHLVSSAVITPSGLPTKPKDPVKEAERQLDKLVAGAELEELF